MIAALALILFGGCTSVDQNGQTISAAEIEVYGALLENKPKYPVVIHNGIVEAFGFDGSSIVKQFEGIGSVTAANFITRNKITPIIPGGSSLKNGFPLVSFKAFEKEYPKHKGHYVFSLVGFNDEQNEAVVWFNENQGISSRGGLTLLRKENGIWLIAAESEKVVS